MQQEDYVVLHPAHAPPHDRGQSGNETRSGMPNIFILVDTQLLLLLIMML